MMFRIPFKTLIYFSAFTALVFFSSCDSCEDPFISDIKFCVTVPSGENQCDENVTVFKPFDPSISASCIVNCVETTDNVIYRLSFNDNGDLITVSENTISIASANREADAYKTFASLPLPPNTMWNIGEWQVDIEIDSAIPVTTSRTFRVEE